MFNLNDTITLTLNTVYRSSAKYDSGTVYWLDATISKVTEKAVQLRLSDNSLLWLPKTAIMTKKVSQVAVPDNLTAEQRQNVIDYNNSLDHSLASWFTPNDYQSYVIQKNRVFSEVVTHEGGVYEDNGKGWAKVK